MSFDAMEFHRIWIEQCEAAENIEGRFGRQRAIDYLVGEKFLDFLEAPKTTPTSGPKSRPSSPGSTPSSSPGSWLHNPKGIHDLRVC